MFSRHKNKYHMLSKIRHERKCQMQQSRLVFLVILMLSKAFFSFFFLFSSCIGQVRLSQVRSSRLGHVLEKFVQPAASFFTPPLKFLNSPETLCLEYSTLPLSTNLRNLSTDRLIGRSKIILHFFNQYCIFFQIIFEKLENKDNCNCLIKFSYLNLF